MNVSAKDKGTGKVQSIRIEASSGLSEDEVKRMKEEAAANAEADKKEKERIDKYRQVEPGGQYDLPDREATQGTG